MASAEFVEEALNNNVDESAVSAIVGSLETQLVADSKAAAQSKNGPERQQPPPQTLAVDASAFRRGGAAVVVPTSAPFVKTAPLLVKPQMTTNVQILSVRPSAPPAAQKNVAAVSPRVVISSPQLVATRPAGPGITLQALQGFQSPQGTLLLKTENGQFQLLRVGPAQQPQQGAVIPGQQVRLAAGVAVASSSGLTVVPPTALQPARPTVTQAPAPVPAASPASAPKASIDNLKEKCRKFLSNLLDLSSKEPKSVERNVRILIQELIDMRVEPEAFCARLEKLLNASPQPCLIGFLKKTLPILRQSLLNKELVIEGIHPPPSNLVYVNSAATSEAGGGASASGPAGVTVLSSQTIVPAGGAKPPPLRSVPRPTAQPAAAKTFVRLASNAPPPPSPLGRQASKDRDRRAASSQSYDADKAGAGDDDINDVAAMGGVNLAEESQRILGSTEAIGAQIRSCKDEHLAAMGPLQARLRRLAAEHGLDEPGFDVAALISHAVHERLKNIVEKLSCIAEHRADVIKTNPDYEATQDVKGQLKFLEDLDRVERKKREDFEREILLRAAKSRSKSEDPEQAKLKEKAKEMQRAEMEEMRQREANLTALQAIGPRKKARIGAGPNDSVSGSDASCVAEAALGTKNGVSRSSAPPRARMKRVNYRDLLFLLEQEKETARSLFLYKCYLK